MRRNVVESGMLRMSSKKCETVKTQKIRHYAVNKHVMSGQLFNIE